MAPDALVAGKTVSAIAGVSDVETALSQALEGTGLTAIPAGDGAFVVTAEQERQPNDVAPEDSLSGVMEEVIVVGELLSRSQQETLTSVYSEAGEQIRRRGETDFNAVTNRMANVTNLGGEFSIRGVSTSGPAGGTGQTITTTIDGARISNFLDQDTRTYSTWDLAQFEALRGPQSTQTGRNALAGSITIRSQDPTFEPALKLGGQLGNSNLQQLAFAANMPVVDDVLAVRISWEDVESDAFVDYPNSTGFTGETSRETGRIGVLWQPTDRASALLKFQHVDQVDPGRFVDRATWPEERVDASEIPEVFSRDLTSWNLTFDYAFTDRVALESNTNYTELDTLFDSGLSSIPGLGGPFPLPRNGQNETLEQEFRLYYETEKVNAVIGGFYTDIDQASQLVGTLPAIIFVGSGVLTVEEIVIAGGNPFTAVVTGGLDQADNTENTAFFSEIEYEFAERMRLIFGLRYDDEERQSTATNVGVLVDGGMELATVTLGPSQDTTANFDAWLPKTAFAYDVDANQTLGITYQRGYRAGGSRLNLGSTPITAFSFDPEYTDNYELSYRSQWRDGALTVNANLFYVDWQDQQVAVQQDTSDALDVIIENSGSSELWGGELELRSSILVNADIYASVGYTQTEFKEFASTSGDFTGNEFPNAPNLTAAIGGAYYFAANWELGGDLTYTGSSFSDAFNDQNNKNDGYWLTNIRATTVFQDKLELTAYVNNLFDEDYTTALTAIAVRAGAPRTYGVAAAFNF
ncbi:MAG: TonB-dependent receptor [Pseudomonadota bacterium]